MSYFKILRSAVSPKLFENTTQVAADSLHSIHKLAMYMADLLTVQANLAGNPAISIPGGETLDGLPMGVQLMTGILEEQELFDLSKLVEETLG